MSTGLGNAAGALLGSMPSGGGTTQTAVNRLVGARSQLAELVTAAVTLGTMLLLAPLIGLMPHATLAAVVIVYSIGLFKPADFHQLVAGFTPARTGRGSEAMWRERPGAV
jgi:MFS superfamily sulfate permease-like transporter